MARFEPKYEGLKPHNHHLMSRMDYGIGYLQHKASENGPFRTEQVKVHNEYGDKWLARFEGKWSRVFIDVKRLYIKFQGEKITIQIDGV